MTRPEQQSGGQVDAKAVGRSFVNVAGTEFWIRVSRAEIKELARAGYTVVPDVVNGDTYWSAKEASP